MTDPQLGADVPLPGEQSLQLIAMTKLQYEQLGNVLLQSQVQAAEQAQLIQATAGLDRCDGSVPMLTRSFVRALDGWATENVSQDFVLKLAKTAASGDLLEEIRRWTNAEGVSTWPDLRNNIFEHFLSACETLKLQAMLERSQQKTGETTASYIRRFRVEATRAYPQVRAESEEARVVNCFLRGFSDKGFAERLFRTGKVPTLDAAILTATEKDAEREKLEQVFQGQGQSHTPMEVDVVENSNSC